jgi:hypothetical protein
MSYKDVDVCNVTQEKSMVKLNRAHRLRKLGSFLRQKSTTIIVWVLLILAATNVALQIVQSTNQNLKQADVKTELTTGFKALTPCVIEPITNYDFCLKKLSIVSKALDIYKGATPNEAIAWGAAQTYFFSLKSERYSDIHRGLKKWALLENYISSDVSTPKALQEALVKSYLTHKPIDSV